MLDKGFISKIYRDGTRLIPTLQQTVTKYDFNQKEAEVHPFNRVPGTIINTIYKNVFIYVYIYLSISLSIYLYIYIHTHKSHTQNKPHMKIIFSYVAN